MEKFIVVAVTFIAVLVTIQADSEIIKEFCETSLHQSQKDTDGCFFKSQHYSVNGERAVLIYACCLGLFGEVTHNYMIYLNDNMVEFILGLTTDKDIINIGRFVKMCKNDSRRISKADYDYWSSHGRTLQMCKAS